MTITGVFLFNSPPTFYIYITLRQQETPPIFTSTNGNNDNIWAPSTFPDSQRFFHCEIEISTDETIDFIFTLPLYPLFA